MVNKILYYIDGDIWFHHNESIIAFDIVLSGKYELESYDTNNFMMFYDNNRVIGVGLQSELGNEPFLKYSGDLSILNCKIVTTDNKIVNITPKKKRPETFGMLFDNFEKTQRTFEDFTEDGIFGEIPDKTKINIITKNLHTSGGEYLLNGKDYNGFYHLHYTGVAMTGKEHGEDSIELKVKDEKPKTKLLNQIRNIRMRNQNDSGSTY